MRIDQKKVLLIFLLGVLHLFVHSTATAEKIRFDKLSWEEIKTHAQGQSINFNMWAGSEYVNRFVSDYLARRLKKEYGITLHMIPVKSPREYIDKVRNEKHAGQKTNGSVDLVWINGENFRRMKEENLLFGPFAGLLPNIRYVDQNDIIIANDFGYPTDGFESPYSKLQFAMIYDSSRTDPPKNIAGLIEWIKSHPGRFTYPALPNFIGSVFVRHLLYHAAGGYKVLLGPYNQNVFDQAAPKLWVLLKEIKPYLWKKGRKYPKSASELENLFKQGEIDFTYSYNHNHVLTKINSGEFPKTCRAYVFEDGTMGNTNYLAIPFNSDNKAAAMVTANLILEPSVQYYKSNPKNWGTGHVYDLSKLPPEWQIKFKSMGSNPAQIPMEKLFTNVLPELQSSWLEHIEDGWRKNLSYR